MTRRQRHRRAFAIRQDNNTIPDRHEQAIEKRNSVSTTLQHKHQNIPVPNSSNVDSSPRARGMSSISRDTASRTSSSLLRGLRDEGVGEGVRTIVGAVVVEVGRWAVGSGMGIGIGTGGGAWGLSVSYLAIPAAVMVMCIGRRVYDVEPFGVLEQR